MGKTSSRVSAVHKPACLGDFGKSLVQNRLSVVAQVQLEEKNYTIALSFLRDGAVFSNSRILGLRTKLRTKHRLAVCVSV